MAFTGDRLNAACRCLKAVREYGSQKPKALTIACPRGTVTGGTMRWIMRLPVVIAVVVLSMAAPAHAVSGVLGRAPDAKACFERTYDAAHLARNPAQTVTRIRISVSRENIPGSTVAMPVDFLRVELTRRGDAQVRRIIAWCEHPFGGEKLNTKGQVTNLGGPGARCRITREDHMSAEEDDSHGDVDIRPLDRGLFAHLSGAVRLRTGDKVSVDKGRMFRLSAADRNFRLTPAPAASCDDLRQAIREE
jgi:hypothetical protein